MTNEHNPLTALCADGTTDCVCVSADIATENVNRLTFLSVVCEAKASGIPVTVNGRNVTVGGIHAYVDDHEIWVKFPEHGTSSSLDTERGRLWAPGLREEVTSELGLSGHMRPYTSAEALLGLL